MGEVRKFLTYPMVIDWLQWAEHPDRLGAIDGPQVTLLLIKEYRDHIKDIESQLEKAKIALKLAEYIMVKNSVYPDDLYGFNKALKEIEGLG